MTVHAQISPSVQNNDNNITESEIEVMARVIEKRHKEHAFAVAHQFMKEHKSIGDNVRASAWNRVAQYIFENTEIS